MGLWGLAAVFEARVFAFVAMLVIIVAVLLCNDFHFKLSGHIFLLLSGLAEGTRFELAVLSYAGFQDQCHQPLGHPSTLYYIINRQNML